MSPRLVVVVLSLLGVAWLSACQSTPSLSGGDAGPLAGTSWLLASLERNGQTREGFDRPPTVTFEDPAEGGEPGGRVGGFSGVNQYFGSCAATSKGKLKVGVLGSTRMAGPPELMDLESDFQAVLQGATSFEMTDEALILRGNSGSARFVRQ